MALFGISLSQAFAQDTAPVITVNRRDEATANSVTRTQCAGITPGANPQVANAQTARQARQYFEEELNAPEMDSKFTRTLAMLECAMPPVPDEITTMRNEIAKWQASWGAQPVLNVLRVDHMVLEPSLWATWDSYRNTLFNEDVITNKETLGRAVSALDACIEFCRMRIRGCDEHYAPNIATLRRTMHVMFKPRIDAYETANATAKAEWTKRVASTVAARDAIRNWKDSWGVAPIAKILLDDHMRLNQPLYDTWAEFRQGRWYDDMGANRGNPILTINAIEAVTNFIRTRIRECDEHYGPNIATLNNTMHSMFKPRIDSYAAALTTARAEWVKRLDDFVADVSRLKAFMESRAIDIVNTYSVCKQLSDEYAWVSRTRPGSDVVATIVGQLISAINGVRSLKEVRQSAGPTFEQDAWPNNSPEKGSWIYSNIKNLYDAARWAYYYNRFMETWNKDDADIRSNYQETRNLSATLVPRLLDGSWSYSLLTSYVQGLSWYGPSIEEIIQRRDGAAIWGQYEYQLNPDRVTSRASATMLVSQEQFDAALRRALGGKSDAFVAIIDKNIAEAWATKTAIDAVKVASNRAIEAKLGNIWQLNEQVMAKLIETKRNATVIADAVKDRLIKEAIRIQKEQERAAEAARNPFSNLIRAFNTAINEVKDFVNDLDNKINDGINKLEDAVNNGLRDINNGLNDLADKAKDAFDKAGNKLKNLPNDIIPVLNQIPNALKDVPNALKDGFKPLIDLPNTLPAAFQPLIDAFNPQEEYTRSFVARRGENIKFSCKESDHFINEIKVDYIDNGRKQDISTEFKLRCGGYSTGDITTVSACEINNIWEEWANFYGATSNDIVAKGEYKCQKKGGAADIRRQLGETFVDNVRSIPFNIPDAQPTILFGPCPQESLISDIIAYGYFVEGEMQQPYDKEQLIKSFKKDCIGQKSCRFTKQLKKQYERLVRLKAGNPKERRFLQGAVQCTSTRDEAFKNKLQSMAKNMGERIGLGLVGVVTAFLPEHEKGKFDRWLARLPDKIFNGLMQAWDVIPEDMRRELFEFAFSTGDKAIDFLEKMGIPTGDMRDKLNQTCAKTGGLFINAGKGVSWDEKEFDKPETFDKLVEICANSNSQREKLDARALLVRSGIMMPYMGLTGLEAPEANEQISKFPGFKGRKYFVTKLYPQSCTAYKAKCPNDTNNDRKGVYCRYCVAAGTDTPYAYLVPGFSATPGLDMMADLMYYYAEQKCFMIQFMAYYKTPNGLFEEDMAARFYIQPEYRPLDARDVASMGIRVGYKKMFDEWSLSNIPAAGKYMRDIPFIPQSAGEFALMIGSMIPIIGPIFEFLETMNDIIQVLELIRTLMQKAQKTPDGRWTLLMPGDWEDKVHAHMQKQNMEEYCDVVPIGSWYHSGVPQDSPYAFGMEHNKSVDWWYGIGADASMFENGYNWSQGLKHMLVALFPVANTKLYFRRGTFPANVQRADLIPPAQFDKTAWFDFTGDKRKLDKNPDALTAMKNEWKQTPDLEDLYQMCYDNEWSKGEFAPEIYVFHTYLVNREFLTAHNPYINPTANPSDDDHENNYWNRIVFDMYLLNSSFCGLWVDIQWLSKNESKFIDHLGKTLNITLNANFNRRDITMAAIFKRELGQHSLSPEAIETIQDKYYLGWHDDTFYVGYLKYTKTLFEWLSVDQLGIKQDVYTDKYSRPLWWWASVVGVGNNVNASSAARALMILVHYRDAEYRSRMNVTLDDGVIYYMPPPFVNTAEQFDHFNAKDMSIDTGTVYKYANGHPNRHADEYSVFAYAFDDTYQMSPMYVLLYPHGYQGVMYENVVNQDRGVKSVESFLIINEQDRPAGFVRMYYDSNDGMYYLNTRNDAEYKAIQATIGRLGGPSKCLRRTSWKMNKLSAEARAFVAAPLTDDLFADATPEKYRPIMEDSNGARLPNFVQMEGGKNGKKLTLTLLTETTSTGASKSRYVGTEIDAKPLENMVNAAYNLLKSAPIAFYGFDSTGAYVHVRINVSESTTSLAFATAQDAENMARLCDGMTEKTLTVCPFDDTVKAFVELESGYTRWIRDVVNTPAGKCKLSGGVKRLLERMGATSVQQLRNTTMNETQLRELYADISKNGESMNFLQFASDVSLPGSELSKNFVITETVDEKTKETRVTNYKYDVVPVENSNSTKIRYVGNNKSLIQATNLEYAKNTAMLGEGHGLGTFLMPPSGETAVRTKNDGKDWQSAADKATFGKTCDATAGPLGGGEPVYGQPDSMATVPEKCGALKYGWTKDDYNTLDAAAAYLGLGGDADVVTYAYGALGGDTKDAAMKNLPKRLKDRDAATVNLLCRGGNAPCAASLNT